MVLPKALVAKVDRSDLVQECQADAAANISQFRGEKAGEFRGWLNGILVRKVAEAIRYWGRKRRRYTLEKPLTSFGNPESNLVGSSTSILEGICRAQDRQRIELVLEQALAWVRDDDRAVILMRHFEDLSHEDIAEELGISPDTARKRYCRAIERARDVAMLLVLMHDHRISSRQQEVVLLHRIRGLRPNQVVEQLALADDLVTNWIAEAEPFFREVERVRDERRTAR
jgi:RNA polymerase sigma-70 factor, ECF subfamily